MKLNLINRTLIIERMSLRPKSEAHVAPLAQSVVSPPIGAQYNIVSPEELNATLREIRELRAYVDLRFTQSKEKLLVLKVQELEAKIAEVDSKNLELALTVMTLQTQLKSLQLVVPSGSKAP